MKTQVTRRKLMAIALFYAIALITRAFALKYETNSGFNLKTMLWIWAEGIGPCLGAIASVIIYKRRFYCSIMGKSVAKSILMIVIPFAICCFINAKLSLVMLSFLFYSFLEEVGWRGYLQGELKDMRPALRIVIVTTMWFLWHLTIGFNTPSLIFYGILLLGSWGIGNIARDSRSLIACACFHGMFNFANHGLFRFTPAIIFLYIAVIIIWFMLWYLPWKK